MDSLLRLMFVLLAFAGGAFLIDPSLAKPTHDTIVKTTFHLCHQAKICR